MEMRSALFWDVTQHRLVFTHISGQHIGHIFSLTFEDVTDAFPKRQ